IYDYTDLYRLEDHQEQLLQLERFGQKSVDNMLAGIKKSKEKPFEKVLFGLGIRHVGETIARKLAQHFKTLDNLKEATALEIGSVHEIGERIAQSVSLYLS